MKKYRWMAAIMLLLILILAACSGADTTPAPDEPGDTGDTGDTGDSGDGADEGPGDTAEAVTVRIGWAGSPDTLNPGVAILSESYIVYELVYDSLYQLELDGSYSFELAESVDISEDGLVYTYTLRDGATFHDGEPVTASDVAFSLNLYQSTVDFVYLPVYTDYFESVEAPDDKTVVITLTEQIPNIESQLIFLYVLPEHVWADHVDDAVDFANDEIVGSGPFKLVEYSEGAFVHLQAVDHYLYDSTVTDVIFQTFESDDALVQALRTGQVDMITELPNTAVASLRNEDNIEVVTGPPLAPELTDIIFNITSEENCPPDDGVCSGHPALQDINVRQALAYATDKQNIIDVVLLGLGEAGLTLIPNSLGVWYNDSIEDYAFDPAMGNQLLDDAGYEDTDGDGVREMPGGGDPLTFRLNWPNDKIEAPRTAELLHDMWLEIGIDTELQALDPDTLTSVCCPTFDFDIIIWGWGSDPDPSFLLSVMTTDEIPTGNSETGYSNPDYDALYVEQQTELDLDRRIEIVWEMQQIVHDDLPYIIPFYPLELQAYRTDRFTGWLTDEGKLALEDVSSLLVIKPVN